MPPGRVLWEYRPPRAHPIVYAGLLLTAAVFLIGSLENLLRERRPELYAVYALPPLVLLLGMVAFAPNPLRIRDDGIELSRPLVLRWRRGFLPWSDVVAAYPSSYDVTGAFVSPFASSDRDDAPLATGASRDRRRNRGRERRCLGSVQDRGGAGGGNLGSVGPRRQPAAGCVDPLFQFRIHGFSPSLS